MEQQMDAFSQKRFEIMMDMATKKMQQEMAALKEQVHSLTNELGSLKSQVTRIQFQPPQAKTIHVQQQAQVLQEQAVGDTYYQPEAQPQAQERKEVKIVDCRSSDEKKTEFVSGAAKNSQEPVRPRFGDYKSQDVSIDKFFYFGRK